MTFIRSWRSKTEQQHTAQNKYK